MYHYIWAAWDTYCTREKFPKSLQPQPGLFFPTKWLVAAEVPKENITHLNLPSDSYHNPYILLLFSYSVSYCFSAPLYQMFHTYWLHIERRKPISSEIWSGEFQLLQFFKKNSCDEYYYKDTINKQLLLGKLRQILWNQRAWWNWICDSSIQLSLWLQWRTKSSSVS